jgi:D-ribulokinase
MSYFLGVDVGTGSSRAGLFSSGGILVKRAARDIKTWTSPDTGHCEQSTEVIWSAVCSAVKVIYD